MRNTYDRRQKACDRKIELAKKQDSDDMNPEVLMRRSRRHYGRNLKGYSTIEKAGAIVTILSVIGGSSWTVFDKIEAIGRHNAALEQVLKDRAKLAALGLCARELHETTESPAVNGSNWYQRYNAAAGLASRDDLPCVPNAKADSVPVEVSGHVVKITHDMVTSGSW